MKKAVWTEEGLAKCILGWVRTRPAEAKREIAISILTAGHAHTVDKAAQMADRVLDSINKNPELLSFGSGFGLDTDEPQINCTARLAASDGGKTFPLLGGLEGTPQGKASSIYVNADGRHDRRNVARKKYIEAFPPATV